MRATSASRIQKDMEVYIGWIRNIITKQLINPNTQVCHEKM